MLVRRCLLERLQLHALPNNSRVPRSHDLHDRRGRRGHHDHRDYLRGHYGLHTELVCAFYSGPPPLPADA